MSLRKHSNRSEKQKGHEPRHEGGEDDLPGADHRQDGKGRQNGGGDGAGGAPRHQHQGGHPAHHEGGPGNHNAEDQTP